MTKIEYDNWLQRIEGENPTEPLLADLRRGFNRVNKIWMRAAVRRLGERKIENVVEIQNPDEVEHPDGEFGGDFDPLLKTLFGEKSRAFSKLNQTANRLHDCSTDGERARVSDEILAIWAKIEVLKSKIAHFKAHGELPDETGERFPLPDNASELTKKLSSIRARITQTKEKLDALAALETGHPDRAKILFFEEKLKELRLYKAHAETKLKSF